MSNCGVTAAYEHQRTVSTMIVVLIFSSVHYNQHCVFPQIQTFKARRMCPLTPQVDTNLNSGLNYRLDYELDCGLNFLDIVENLATLTYTQYFARVTIPMHNYVNICVQGH